MSHLRSLLVQMKSMKLSRRLAPQRLLALVLVGGGLAVASPPFASVTSFSSTAPNPGFVPALLGGSALSDPPGDTTGSREIVGDSTHPVLYVASDSTHIYYRVRLNADPTQYTTSQTSPRAQSSESLHSQSPLVPHRPDPHAALTEQIWPSSFKQVVNTTANARRTSTATWMRRSAWFGSL
jgi:hypothetical protein